MDDLKDVMSKPGEHDLVLHRLPHRDRDGAWTWRVRGAKVAASNATNVSLTLAPEADHSDCPDCQANAAVRWEAPVVKPRVVKCGACGSQFVLALTDRC